MSFRILTAEIAHKSQNKSQGQTLSNWYVWRNLFVVSGCMSRSRCQIPDSLTSMVENGLSKSLCYPVLECGTWPYALLIFLALLLPLY